MLSVLEATVNCSQALAEARLDCHFLKPILLSGNAQNFYLFFPILLVKENVLNLNKRTGRTPSISMPS